MSIGKHEVDKLLGLELQEGSSKGWFSTYARCPECKRNMWSNKKMLHCPRCNIYKEIKVK